MSPINVDGSTVSTVTVDGTDVSEITIDGSVAFQAEQPYQAGSLWHSPAGIESIYGTDQSGNITSAFSIATIGEGLGIDLQNCIWVGDYITHTGVIQYTQSGNYVSSFDHSFSGAAGAAGGIGVDSDNCLWIANRDNNVVIEFDQSGTALNSFNTSYPGDQINSPGGLGVDSNNSLWISARYASNVHKFASDPIGSWIASFSLSSGAGEGVAAGNDLSIWLSNRVTDIITKYNDTGSAIQSFTVPGGTDAYARGLGIESTFQ